MNRVACFLVMGALVVALSPVTASADEASHATEQTVCPVMEGNPIKKGINVSHQGQTVYFCCDFCKGEFLKAPEKYLGMLPQFADAHSDVADDAPDHAHDTPTSTGWQLHRFTGPLGIATFSLLILTLCTGFLRRKLKRRFLAIHRPLAIATVAVATLHVLTVLLGH